MLQADTCDCEQRGEEEVSVPDESGEQRFDAVID